MSEGGSPDGLLPNGGGPAWVAPEGGGPDGLPSKGGGPDGLPLSPFTVVRERVLRGYFLRVCERRIQFLLVLRRGGASLLSP